MDNIITDANVLYDAYKAAKKDSAWKPQVQQFEWNFLSNISKLQRELSEETYHTKKPTEFLLNERGKTRPITGLQMRDRVARHALCDELLTPGISPHLQYDNGASQTGKGIDFQRKRLKVHLRRYFNQYKTNEGYILIIDFSKYYDNIQHDVAKGIIDKYVKESKEIKWLVDHIFQSYEVNVSYMTDEEYSKCLDEVFDSVTYRLNQLNNVPDNGRRMNKSIQIGDQVAQIIGVSYANQIDDYIKIVRGVHYYGRYMDDSYVISNDKQFLNNLLDEITEIANKNGIFINGSKTRICKISKPFRFLQNSYFLTDTGRVVERINPKSITRMRRKLKSLFRMVKNGERTISDTEQCFYPWIKARKSIMSRQQKRNMYLLYDELLSEVTK